MRILRQAILSISTIALLFSCAQVGTISGGDRDEYAPKPDMEKASPPNGSTNFNGKQIIIPFDEYFTINNPTSTIRMVPPDASIKASFKKRDLILEWEEDLRENTTYSIYLDKAVSDITEKNDSLMQFVFSTGSHIDSISYSSYVISAWTKAPVKDVYAFLYSATDSSLISYAKSNAKGNFSLNYLPPGEFYLSVVDDVFPDQKWSPGEQTAFKGNSIIEIRESVNDSLPFLLSKPIEVPSIRAVNYVGYGMLYLGIHPSRIGQPINLDGKEIGTERIVQLEPDSLLIHLPLENRSKGSHILTQGSDSLRFRITAEEKKWVLKSGHKNDLLRPKEELTLHFDGRIASVAEEHVHVLSALDSSVIHLDSIHFVGNELKISFPKKENKAVFVLIDSATVHGELGQNANFEKKFTLLQERELGTINLNAEYFSSALIIDVLQENKEIMRLYTSPGDRLLKIDELLPGNYTFRVVVDENANRIWDTIDPVLKKQAELVYYFEGDNKLRANWELDIHLRPEEDE